MPNYGQARFVCSHSMLKARVTKLSGHGSQAAQPAERGHGAAISFNTNSESLLANGWVMKDIYLTASLLLCKCQNSFPAAALII